MTINDLIEHLQKIKEKYSDLPVYIDLIRQYGGYNDELDEDYINIMNIGGKHPHLLLGKAGS